VFTKIFGSTTAGPVNDANINAAYQLFYPDDTLASNIRASLTALGNTQSSDTERWKMIILGLCVSPEWQSI
jgi:hypothetical protein